MNKLGIKAKKAVIEKISTKIKIMFKIIGAAAAAANLLCEFRIAEKNEAKQIKNKKGKVILVKFTAASIFSKSPTKPGAIIETNAGMKISTIIVKNNSPIKRRLKISLANLFDCFFPLIISDEQLGTNAALKVPSANNLLKVFGILNATKKASANIPVPRKIAIKISLK